MIPFNKMFTKDEIEKGSKPDKIRYVWYAIGVLTIIGVFYTSINIAHNSGYLSGYSDGIDYGKGLCEHIMKEKGTNI
jgi:hypothetical protein